jgi:hypothetical protein
MALDVLLDRLFDAQGKSRLQRLLRTVKEKKNLARDELRTTGTIEELAQIVTGAVNKGHLTLDQIAETVDVCEENGAQHVFVFNLTDQGKQDLKPETLKQAFPVMPSVEEQAQLLAGPRTFTVARGNRVAVKHIRLQDFWETDRDRSRYGSDEEVIYRVKRSIRGTHMFVVDPASGHVELRLDRVRPLDDRKLAQRMLDEVKSALAPHVDFDKHLEVVPIWNGFGKIVEKAKDETFLTVDEGYDNSVTHRISSRRAGTYGKDVRDNKNYILNGLYVRDALGLRWHTPAGLGNDEVGEVHTFMSRFNVGDCDYAKVYLGARVTPEELQHVLDRIRFFASAAA